MIDLYTLPTPNGQKVHILPFSDTIEGLGGNITETYLIPYFKQNFRPVCVGDCFIVSENHFKAVEFKVVAIENEGGVNERCIVSDNTQLFDDCPLYPSDAADDLLCVDPGGRRIIKKKKNIKKHENTSVHNSVVYSLTHLPRLR